MFTHTAHQLISDISIIHLKHLIVKKYELVCNWNNMGKIGCRSYGYSSTEEQEADMRRAADKLNVLRDQVNSAVFSQVWEVIEYVEPEPFNAALIAGMLAEVDATLTKLELSGHQLDEE